MASSSSSVSPTDPEKQDATAGDIKITESERRASTSSENKRPATISGARLDLLMGAILPCVPIIAIMATLLGLIFRNRVILDPGWQLLESPTSENVYDPATLRSLLNGSALGHQGDYYTRYNPAVLAAVAAWTSKVLPWFTGSSMCVVAFFAGRRILDAAKNEKLEELPTPHQMAIMINLFQKTQFISLWNTFLYRWQNHKRLVKPIPAMFAAFASLMFITLLIGIVDTWFAASTQPINVALIDRTTASSYTYGRDLDMNACPNTSLALRPCPQSSSLCGYPCSISAWNYTTGGVTANKEGIQGAEEAAETLLGNSEVNLIQNYTYMDYAPNAVPQEHFFLGDIMMGQSLDYLSNTTAVTTQCEVITQDCTINSTTNGFACPGYSSPSFTYPGDVGVDPSSATAPENMSMVGIQFFTDQSHQSPIGLGNKTTTLFGAQNPMYFLTWSKGFPPIDTSSSSFDYMKSGKYLQLDSTGDNVFILNCTSTIYHTIYAWVNGSILPGSHSAGFYPSLAPQAYGAIYSAPFAMGSALGHLALQDAAALAAYKTKPQDMADRFSSEFSRAAVALTAGIMAPIPNMLEQSRNNTELLTRVVKVPLFFLVGLQAFYILALAVLGVCAWCLTGPHEAQEIKERMTVAGLTAALFEDEKHRGKGVTMVEELYSEHEQGGKGGNHKRVGLRQTRQGGWVYDAKVLEEEEGGGEGKGA